MTGCMIACRTNAIGACEQDQIRDVRHDLALPQVIDFERVIGTGAQAAFEIGQKSSFACLARMADLHFKDG
jgi:hypothetical protein